jgi:hypothetical protein
MKTNWSTPKTNYLAALNDLRKALSYGYSARLVKMRNEDCDNPIRILTKNLDWRAYESSGAYMRTRSEILADKSMSEQEKEITLNYHGCFGTQEAVDKYYETGEVSADNFKGIGRFHLVKVKDMVEFWEKLGNPKDKERIAMFKRQYITLEDAEQRHFYQTIRLKRDNSKHVVKQFKRKLWVVAVDEKDEKVKIPFGVKVLNVFYTPLKYIPKHSVLRMKEYNLHTFRVGGVVNGYSVEFHIPKKFSFK